MANSYTQIHIQAIFVVKYRECVIRKSWKDDLFGYITGIVQKNDHKVLAINGMPDHVHLFFGMRPSQSLSDLMQDVKADSTKWVNNQGFLETDFKWQPGYAAFSYCKSHVDTVMNYIRNQQKHHMHKSFKQEYLEFLEEFEVPYDERYLFESIDYSSE